MPELSKSLNAPIFAVPYNKC